MSILSFSVHFSMLWMASLVCPKISSTYRRALRAEFFFLFGSLVYFGVGQKVNDLHWSDEAIFIHGNRWMKHAKFG